MSSHSDRDRASSQDALVTQEELLSPGEVVPHRAGPVTLNDREGVFAHSFRCPKCQLEFVLVSWKRSRHRADNTFCPECGEVTEKMHWRACLSESQDFVSDGTSVEIFNVTLLGDAELISTPKRD
jgi:predicted RNA-binding Zn-ribbon protein involved in translation (DUF1610 family)